MGRDLKADFEICNKATPGPWNVAGPENTIKDADGKQVCFVTIHGSSMHGRSNIPFIAAAREGWPEAIERAIKAEEEYAKLQKYHVDKQTEYVDMYKKLNDKKSALTEESDLQRASIQQLSAQVVALQEGLKYSLEQWAMYADAGQIEGYYLCEGNDSEGEKYNSIRQLLSSPDPGKQYREKVAKMQRVVDNARFLLQVNQNGCMSQIGESELAKALADLEGVGKQ